jgi:hypothetical protein
MLFSYYDNEPVSNDIARASSTHGTRVRLFLYAYT